MHPVHHVTVSIPVPPAEVYGFASQPENLTQWAAGLARSRIHQDGDHWVADSPMGDVRILFAKANEFGVLDHDVTLPNGETFHNPMRVVPNGDGSEVTFTLYQRDEGFAADRAAVEKDLQTLKELLTGRCATTGP